MVHFKIILQTIFFTIFLYGCSDKKISEKLNLNSKNALKFKVYEKQYCFGTIYKQANKNLDKQSDYFLLDTLKLYKFLGNGNKPLESKFKDFVNYTTDTKFYLLKSKKNYIIAIGMASGASALGSDYWSYLCYSITEKKETKFNSLINSPFSLFISNDKIEYIEVVDNIPRPANGEIIKLNYTPLISTVYDINKKPIKKIVINCY